MGCFTSVSYTHLDVYKRQVYNREHIVFLVRVMALNNFILHSACYLFIKMCLVYFTVTSHPSNLQKLPTHQMIAVCYSSQYCVAIIRQILFIVSDYQFLAFHQQYLLLLYCFIYSIFYCIKWF